MTDHTSFQRYQIVLQLEPSSRLPYRILETFPTLEGPRSRITGLCYASFEEAKAALPRQRKSRAKRASALNLNEPL